MFLQSKRVNEKQKYINKNLSSVKRNSILMHTHIKSYSRNIQCMLNLLYFDVHAVVVSRRIVMDRVTLCSGPCPGDSSFKSTPRAGDAILNINVGLYSG